MKKVLICSVALAFLCTTGLVSMSMASDKGAADITMESTIDKAEKPKPAIFTHAKHQETMACADCHHGQDAEGKQTAYVEEMKIEKCESCHNKGAGIANVKLATLKGAAHAQCQACHKDIAKKNPEDPAKKALSKCSTCHPKKKK